MGGRRVQQSAQLEVGFQLWAFQCVNVACSLHTWVFWKPREASQHATFYIFSPFKSGQRSFKKTEEKKAEPCSTDVISSSPPKPPGKGQTKPETQGWKTRCPNPVPSVPLLLWFLSWSFVSFHGVSCDWLSSFSCVFWSSYFSCESDETSPASDRAEEAKKRFTLQGFSNITEQKGNCRPLLSSCCHTVHMSHQFWFLCHNSSSH